jgi:hypothetical protein
MYKMMEKLRQVKQKQCMLLYSTIATQRATADMGVKLKAQTITHRLLVLRASITS